MNNVEFGKYGETLAINFLKKHEYIILDKNFSCRAGEIDIIAKDKKELVFLEVKTRKNNFFGRAREAVNGLKKKHIYNVAKYYLYKNNLINECIRFDVIEVYVKNQRIFINHIQNMFI